MADKDKRLPPINIDINPETTPIYFTDNINFTVNEDGVVLNFCQHVGSGRMHVVSRIGMSKEHAKKFINKLGGILVTDSKLKTSSKVKN